MSPDRVTVEAVITRRVTVDVAELIRRHPERYARLDTTGYEAWERPALLVEDVLDDEHGPWGAGDEVDLRWTEDDYARLVAVCPDADLAAVARRAAEDPRRPYDEPMRIDRQFAALSAAFEEQRSLS